MEQKPKDWQAFFGGILRDSPVPDVVNMVRELQEDGRLVVFASGRPELYRVPTELWLCKHVQEPEWLFMRKNGDYREDSVVKREILQEIKDFWPAYEVTIAIDDRPQVIEMWKEEGLTVFEQVDPGLEPL